MANPEHVALARKGAGAIAAWWKAHRDERLDLSEVDLSGVNLNRANLGSANLKAANLSAACFVGAVLHMACLIEADLGGADLVGASLVGADLRRANLAGANLGAAYLNAARLNEAWLVEANLNVADLSAANLSSANLSFARLIGANLNQVTLGGADLSQAQFGGTSLGNVDLSKASGLAAANHGSPSHIGVDTLMASFRGAGNRLTPGLATFFLGAGVPQGVLEALPRIVSEIKYHSCFISYGHPDVTFATKLRQDLEARGVSCWLYEMDKTVGKPTRREIGESRRGADRFVVLCSAAALVRDPVLEEIEDQINDDPERLVPISLDNLWKEPGFKVIRGNHNLKPDLENRNYADFANKPYEEALEELLRGLRRSVAKKPRRSKKSS